MPSGRTRREHDELFCRYLGSLFRYVCVCKDACKQLGHLAALELLLGILNLGSEEHYRQNEENEKNDARKEDRAQHDCGLTAVALIGRGTLRDIHHLCPNREGQHGDPWPQLPPETGRLRCAASDAPTR